MTTIEIPKPVVPHGLTHLTEDESTAQYLREASRDLRNFYKPFGSNLRATVCELLDNAAAALEAVQGAKHVPPVAREGGA